MAQCRLSACLLERVEEKRGGRREEREGDQGLQFLADIPVSSPQLPYFHSCFLAIALPSGFSGCCSTVIGSLSPFPAPQQHQRPLHIHRLPNLSVIQDLLIDKVLVYLAGP